MNNVIYSIGEALIDFIPGEKGKDLKNVISFERVAGGAPANVAAVVAKLGGKSTFISKLGRDAFGDYIVDVLNSVGVNTCKILRTSKANTGLAFVSLKEDGNRDFSFFRSPSADMLLSEDDIDEDTFKGCHTLHFCSVDLIEAPVKYAHKKALEIVLKSKSIISFDPNVRLPLWNNKNQCKSTILEFLQYAHIIKISDEELEFITGYKDIKDAKEFLLKDNCKIVIYTKGGNGAEIFTKNLNIGVDGVKVNTIDTTGAGDSFIGAFLYKLLEDNITLDSIDKLNKEKLKKYLTFANYYACNTTTKKGAIGAMATRKEIDLYIRGIENECTK